MRDGISTEQKIRAWADWSRSQNPLRALDYKSPSLALLRSKMGGGVPLPTMNDDEALIIDAAVTRLLAKQPQLHRAFLMYYLHGKSMRAIAKHLDLSSTILVQSAILRAVCWIEGQLDGIDLDAA